VLFTTEPPPRGTNQRGVLLFTCESFSIDLEFAVNCPSAALPVLHTALGQKRGSNIVRWRFAKCHLWLVTNRRAQHRNERSDPRARCYFTEDLLSIIRGLSPSISDMARPAMPCRSP
jgi:hypothetical protein